MFDFSHFIVILYLVPTKNGEEVKNMLKKPFNVVDADFIKSSWSKNNPKTCVMVAIKPEGVAVRDSKDSSKSTMFFSFDEWTAFIKGVKGGEFNPTSNL